MGIGVTMIIAFIGVCLGSFVNALVWRMKQRKDWVRGRSECVRCHHVLAANDLIPVLSWIFLRGKCRYCKQPISIQYPLVELATGGLFALSYAVWPYPIAGNWYEIVFFILWLLAIILLMAALVFDIHWKILPNKLTYSLALIGVVMLLIKAFFLSDNAITVIIDGLLGLLPITGVYGVLFAVSRGRWVGLGDVKLGVFIGLLLGWKLALLVLLLANIIGTLTILPGLATKKIKRQSHVPFGPFLIAATIIGLLFGAQIISWYTGLFTIQT